MNYTARVLALILSIVTSSAPGFAQDSLKSAQGLQWGSIAGGLQVACIPEVPAGVLHCWIRNGLREEVSYNHCFVGYWEAVRLEFRNVSGWQRLERIKQTRAINGIGPSERDARKLAPLATIEDGGVSFADARLGLAVSLGDGGIMVPHREDVPPPSLLRSTFILDLAEFSWPDGVLAKPVEVRIVQELSGPGQAGPIEIYSPSLLLEGPAIQRIVDQLAVDPNPPKK